jgi:hypothetical protein
VKSVGGPIIHLAHDRPAAAVGSLLLRVGLGIGSTYVGAYVGNDPESGEGAILGLLAGMLVAGTVDAAALAYEDEKPSPRPQTGLSWSPTIAARPYTATIGVVGAF